jgi:hypothetical protein
VEELKSVESYLFNLKQDLLPLKAESIAKLELNLAVTEHCLNYAVALAYSINPEKIYF